MSDPKKIDERYWQALEAGAAVLAFSRKGRVIEADFTRIRRARFRFRQDETGGRWTVKSGRRTLGEYEVKPSARVLLASARSRWDPHMLFEGEIEVKVK